MVSAMKAVEDKEMNISAAAAKFSVPRKTLGDRLKGHVKHEKKPGVDRVLTVEEEVGLAATVHPEDLASDQDTGIMKDSQPLPKNYLGKGPDYAVTRAFCDAYAIRDTCPQEGACRTNRQTLIS